MTGNNIMSVRKNSDEADEVLIPKLLLVVLWIARAVGAVPAGLRRAHSGWKLSVSSPLVKLQKAVVIITSTLYLLFKLIKTIETGTICSRVAGTCVSNIIQNIELSLIVITYALGIYNSPNKLRAMIYLIRTIQKINNSFDYDTYKNKRQSHNVIFIIYVIWKILTAIEEWIQKILELLSEPKQEDKIGAISTSWVLYYQDMTITIIRLMIYAVVLELMFTLTLLNDKLEDLLVTPPKELTDIKLKLYLRELIPQKATKMSDSFTKGRCCQEEPEPDSRSQEDVRGIRHMNRCYDSICDLVAQTDKVYGPILLIFLMLLSLQLLTASQLLIAGLGASRIHVVIRQANRILTFITDLLVLVEPCQRLQNQMDRTRRLLGRLACQPQRWGCDPAQLDLFILQAQMRDVAIAPMGVITIGRSLVGSIIGGVVTYLIIIMQFQNA